ncbi:hypothetical protein GCM10025751_21990 [Haladaptatus pallidirubidus]|uniref:DUF7344 domain-containing protein n=1 Tax=Haladaptatus pallidirubidus TaxID=1008152 RepID=A0AAV3UGP0_9EURY
MDSDEYEKKVERVLISLHHNYLPKLADAGLVEYDRDENLVSESGDTTVDTTWLSGEEIDKLLPETQTGTRPDENAIGLIEERENVIEYGQSLADEADEELFCMYVSDDLLEEECIHRAEDAIERGVDIYLGSRNQNVRDIVRQNLPEATLWEPQSDWMRIPPKSSNVGRLMLADRQKVMLALLDEENTSGMPTETAMIGSGLNNPLVVLVRDLLGSRLDHLDYQSDDFRSRLPFEP